MCNEKNVLIEINTSDRSRWSDEQLYFMLNLMYKYNVNFVYSSDAHKCEDIGYMIKETKDKVENGMWKEAYKDKIKIWILHAGLEHTSPYFYNFCLELKKYNKYEYIINPNLPIDENVENGIVYFNRLKDFIIMTTLVMLMIF